MTTLKKGLVVRAHAEIAIKGDGFTALPVGTILYCARGGKNPKLVFEVPNGGKLMALSLQSSLLAPKLTATTKDNLPERLASYLGMGANDAPIPTFRKGDIAKVKKSFDLDKFTVPAGTMVRCTKGGETVDFLFRHPVNRELMGMSISGKALSDFEHAEPVVDKTLIGVQHKIKTFESISEETPALSGRIHLPNGKRIDVSCHGAGDPVNVSGAKGQTAVADLEGRLTNALQEGGVDPQTVTDPCDHYVHYATSTEGTETYAEYVAIFEQQMARLAS